MPIPLADRLLTGRGLGELDGLGLARAIRRGTERLAVLAVSALAVRPEDQAREFIEAQLADDRAAVTRAAARALGRRGDARSLPALSRARSTRGRDEDALAVALATVRCSPDAIAARTVAIALLDARDRRTYPTVGGPRRLAFDVPPLPERLALALDQPERDYGALAASLAVAGRREQHVIFNALGLSADPRALPLLVDALRATDVDPGRGFTQRRLAATAIGRIGLREGTPVLLRALKDEALDFEGRPGAGMGIQYPVRTNLIWALGELGDLAAVPTLVSYLGNTTGSAFGGFYLAAMDALWKYGAVAIPALRDAVATAPDVAAAHALGVLIALGEDPAPWRADRRPDVARVAQSAGSTA